MKQQKETDEEWANKTYENAKEIFSRPYEEEEDKEVKMAFLELQKIKAYGLILIVALVILLIGWGFWVWK